MKIVHTSFQYSPQYGFPKWDEIFAVSSISKRRTRTQASLCTPAKTFSCSRVFRSPNGQGSPMQKPRPPFLKQKFSMPNFFQRQIARLFLAQRKSAMVEKCFHFSENPSVSY